MNRNDLRKVKEEKGAVAVVEMTFVFPIVLAMIFFLFFIANCLLQSANIYHDAQRIAVLAARTVEIPGYNELYKDTRHIETTADFNITTDDSLHLNLIEAIMRHHDPYRYLFKSFSSTIGEGEGSLETAAINMMKNLSFMGAKDYRCDIGVEGSLFSRTVRVKLDEDIPLPGIVRLLTNKEVYTMSVTAYAGISDSAEFVRNTEMVCDLADYLYENLKIGSSGKTMAEMVKDFKEKIKSLSGKFGLKLGDGS